MVSPICIARSNAKIVFVEIGRVCLPLGDIGFVCEFTRNRYVFAFAAEAIKSATPTPMMKPFPKRSIAISSA